MKNMINLIRNANASTLDTYKGIHWVLMELVSPYARGCAVIALSFLLVSVGCLSAIPLTLQHIYDAYARGDLELAQNYLWYTLLISISGSFFGTLHDHFREKTWNRNYFTINVTLAQKLFDRTYDEILGENSEIGAEQIESTKDRAQNILYLLLFEAPVVIISIVTATIFIFLICSQAGAGLIFLTIFNLTWFYLFNTTIDRKMKPIDKTFRRANRRLVEKLNLAASVKASGVEKRVVEEVGEEFKMPLEQDLYIWAYWFQKFDSIRRLVNACAPVGVVLYGITYTTMTVGELSAVTSWVFTVSREYGFIGNLMRQLTSQISRIKAARESLSKPPLFNFEAGIIYERNKDVS
ncbi:ABC transporter ATP-binding protein [Candidatus Nomurabacteria bacterium]|nr:ABC transporter ATP-binding protein [Candidatus Nomurabacteria bacterium]